MQIRSLSDDEHDACLDLWDAGFSSTPRDYFVRYFAHDRDRRSEDTVVCAVDGRLVSVAHVVRRTVSTPDGPRRMAGIANVATHPDFRGNGYNTACLTELLRRLDTDPELDFGLLGTGIHDYYARLSWQRWTFAGLRGTVVAGGPVQGVRPATGNDLATIAALYTASNARQAFAVHRTVPYWQGWCDWKPDATVVTDDLSGYLCWRRDGGWFKVLELGGSDAAVDALLVHAASLAVALGVPRSTWNIPPTGAVRSAASRVLTDIAPAPVSAWMVRPLGGKPLPPSGDTPYYYEADGF
jgi:GNAT superfamily N-acetyltransferase